MKRERGARYLPSPPGGRSLRDVTHRTCPTLSGAFISRHPYGVLSCSSPTPREQGRHGAAVNQRRASPLPSTTTRGDRKPGWT